MSTSTTVARRNRPHLRLFLAGLSISCALAQETRADWSSIPKITPADFSPVGVANVAVMVTEAVERPDAEEGGAALADAVGTAFEEVLFARGYPLVTRTEVDKVSKELQLQHSGVTDQKGLQRAGKLMNVSHILLVEVALEVSANRTGGPAAPGGRPVAPTTPDGRPMPGRGTYVPGAPYQPAPRMAVTYNVQGSLNSKLLAVETGEYVALSSGQIADKIASPDEQLAITRHYARKLASAYPAKPGTPAGGTPISSEDVKHVAIVMSAPDPRGALPSRGNLGRRRLPPGVGAGGPNPSLLDPALQNRLRGQTGPAGNQLVSGTVQQAFEEELKAKGYSLVTRTEVDRIAEELKFQHNGITDSIGLQRAGKMLNASHILAVQIIQASAKAAGPPDAYGRSSGAGNEVRVCMSAKLIGVETGRYAAILSDEGLESSPTSDLTGPAKRLARKISTRFPKHGAATPSAPAKATPSAAPPGSK